MDPHLATTPFGLRSLSLAMVASQTAAKACPPDAVVHKWEIFRAICEGKAAIGASDRALAVLNALMTFHPETMLTGQGDLIVFPSNQQLALRAHGMAPATLRRHLAALVDCGLVIRRDSPNGKRYARRGEGGAVDQAFGFDLTPLVARAGEFQAWAQAARMERRALALVRERITLSRRDIVKMIAAGLEEQVAGDWKRFHEAYCAIAARIPRTATCEELEPLAQSLGELCREVREALERHVKTTNTSANESQTERHIQNSNTNPTIDSEKGLPERPSAKIQPKSDAPQPRRPGFPLDLVLKACPDITMYARGGVANWRDLVELAGLVRSALGISPSAWEEARAALGDEEAAVTIAGILQRAEEISSPGGYLRGLTAKAVAGQFSTGPMIMALLRKQTRREPIAS